MSNHYENSLKLHAKHKGKIEVVSKLSLENREDLSLAYTPGVAEPCRQIAENKENVYQYTAKGNLVAIVSDGSAVLGLGNIGPEAALPVMEGKAILFKEFGNVDAFPVCIDTQDTEEIIDFVKKIAPTFGGINLEDISAPRCFEIEERLKKELNIPVFHDDQHGTAIVTLAGLINALKLVNKKIENVKIVMSGVGSAGVAITKLLIKYGAKNFYLCDSRGVIYEGRKEGMNPVKEELAKITNPEKISGNLEDVLKGADIFIGVSQPKLVSKEMIETMNTDSIVFAMANPEPEIMPDLAKAGGAKIVATGRSDFPNQINNVLAFPGLFRGVLDSRVKQITPEMNIAVAEALADYVKDVGVDKIIPDPLDKGVAKIVAAGIQNFGSVRVGIQSFESVRVGVQNVEPVQKNVESQRNRRSIRLQGYDYSQDGAYFITICTKNREQFFGKISDNIVNLTQGGQIAKKCWEEIPEHYPNVILDKFVIMPNHVHGILIIQNAEAQNVRIQNLEPQRFEPVHFERRNQFQKIIPRSIGSIVRGFKIGVTKWFRQNTDIHIVWQRNFYENIIRNEKALFNIQKYIVNNPVKWEEDKLFI